MSTLLIFETELVNMSNRTWMYNGWQRGKAPSNEWIHGTNEFLNSVFSVPGVAKMILLSVLVHNVETTLGI